VNKSIYTISSVIDGIKREGICYRIYRVISIYLISTMPHKYLMSPAGTNSIATR